MHRERRNVDNAELIRARSCAMLMVSTMVKSAPLNFFKLKVRQQILEKHLRNSASQIHHAELKSTTGRRDLVEEALRD